MYSISLNWNLFSPNGVLIHFRTVQRVGRRNENEESTLVDVLLLISDLNSTAEH